MKSRLSIKLCQKNLLTEKKYERQGGRDNMPNLNHNVRVKKTSKKLFYRLTPIWESCFRPITSLKSTPSRKLFQKF